MEKQEADTLTGTVSQVLEQLSIDIPRVVFQESKNKLKKDQEKPKDETSKKTMNYESKSTTINPYNASFFVQSITIPEK
jgi:capsule polysaccharide modification protein KpsS